MGRLWPPKRHQIASRTLNAWFWCVVFCFVWRKWRWLCGEVVVSPGTMITRFLGVDKTTLLNHIRGCGWERGWQDQHWPESWWVALGLSALATTSGHCGGWELTSDSLIIIFWCNVSKLVSLSDLNLKTWCHWRTAGCAACLAPWERTSSGRWRSLTGRRLPGGSRSMASSLRPRASLTLLQSHSRSSRTPWKASHLKLDSILWVLSRCVVRCVLASSGLGRRLPRLYQGLAHFSSLNDLMKTRERRSERTVDRLILYRTQMQMKLQKVLLLKYRTGAILFVRLLQVVFQPHKEGSQ